MTNIHLKVAELRKYKRVSQQDVANALGISFQTVSKWETGTTMPDIGLLPAIADYFEVTIDELLGVKPLKHLQYLSKDTDQRDKWAEKAHFLHLNRKYFWNDDYMAFLVKFVWKLDKPIHVIEFQCGDAYLGAKLMALLPEGSQYTGIDSVNFIELAKQAPHNVPYNMQFMEGDLYTIPEFPKYDLAICHGGIRHKNKPLEALKSMVGAVKSGGLVVSVEVNREFENVGTYIEDFDYDALCTDFDYHKIWRKEFAEEGRDYAIGMRVPLYMKQLGLKNIDIRMNDKVMFADPNSSDYESLLGDFRSIKGYDKNVSPDEESQLIERFMSCGLDRYEAETYLKQQREVSRHFREAKDAKAFLRIIGLMVSYGWK